MRIFVDSGGESRPELDGDEEKSAEDLRYRIYDFSVEGLTKEQIKECINKLKGFILEVEDKL